MIRAEWDTSHPCKKSCLWNESYSELSKPFSSLKSMIDSFIDSSNISSSVNGITDVSQGPVWGAEGIEPVKPWGLCLALSELHQALLGFWALALLWMLWELESWLRWDPCPLKCSWSGASSLCSQRKALWFWFSMQAVPQNFLGDSLPHTFDSLGRRQAWSRWESDLLLLLLGVRLQRGHWRNCCYCPRAVLGCSGRSPKGCVLKDKREESFQGRASLVLS